MFYVITSSYYQVLDEEKLNIYFTTLDVCPQTQLNIPKVKNKMFAGDCWLYSCFYFLMYCHLNSLELLRFVKVSSLIVCKDILTHLPVYKDIITCTYKRGSTRKIQSHILPSDLYLVPISILSLMSVYSLQGKLEIDELRSTSTI